MIETLYNHLRGNLHHQMQKHNSLFKSFLLRSAQNHLEVKSYCNCAFQARKVIKKPFFAKKAQMLNDRDSRKNLLTKCQKTYSPNVKHNSLFTMQNNYLPTFERWLDVWSAGDQMSLLSLSRTFISFLSEC